MEISVLSIVVILFAVVLMVGVCVQVAKGRLLLRYSLLWLALGILAIFFAVFPLPLFQLAYFLGFNVASNFVLFVGLFFVLAICLSLSVITSKQQMKIKDLAQKTAILENEIRAKRDSAIREDENGSQA